MMLKRTLIIVFIVVALIGGLWGADILSDRSYKLAVVRPAPLYSLPPHEYPRQNPTLATLTPGQHIRVLRLRYGKDFQSFRVETEGGVVGWVIAGEGIEVMSHG
jgi:hypothetical protein